MPIVNLLPEDYANARIRQRIFRICLVMFPLVLGCTVTAVVISGRTCSRTMQVRQHLSRSYGDARELAREFTKVDLKRREILRQAELNASLLDGGPRSYALAMVANAMPEHTSLTRLELDAQPSATEGSLIAGSATNTAPKAGSSAPGALPQRPRMRLTGLAATDVAVGILIANLSRSPLVATVDLRYSQAKPNEQGVREFQVLLELKPNADAFIAGLVKQRNALDETERKPTAGGPT